jgi:FAD/FMN-containing dehydrogenase
MVQLVRRAILRASRQSIPKNEAALVDYIQSTSGALRPVGSGHSFSPLVPTDGHIIVIDQLRGLLGYDEKSGDATFGAGTMLADLGGPLNQVGRAMINMPRH